MATCFAPTTSPTSSSAPDPRPALAGAVPGPPLTRGWHSQRRRARRARRVTAEWRIAGTATIARRGGATYRLEAHSAARRRQHDPRPHPPPGGARRAAEGAPGSCWATGTSRDRCCGWMRKGWSCAVGRNYSVQSRGERLDGNGGPGPTLCASSRLTSLPQSDHAISLKAAPAHRFLPGRSRPANGHGG